MTDIDKINQKLSKPLSIINKERTKTNYPDIIKYIESKEEDCIEKYRLLLTFQKVKKEFRNEKILMLFLLNFIYFRSNDYLENISFM